MKLQRLSEKRWLVVLLSSALMVALGTGAAMAAHSFLDVADDHVFHEDIEWMKEHGITRGCNPPSNNRYCPDDYTTRGQMAAFIKRLSQSGVIDAGTLDGIDSTEFVTRTEIGELEGVAGPQGPAGEPGPQGPQGQPGEFSTANVTIREATAGTGLVQIGSTYIATCEPGELAIGGGYDADLDLVDLGSLTSLLNTLGLGDLVSALDGVSTTSISANGPTEHDGKSAWQVTATGAALSDVTVQAVCAG